MEYRRANIVGIVEKLEMGRAMPDLCTGALANFGKDYVKDA